MILQRIAKLFSRRLSKKSLQLLNALEAASNTELTSHTLYQQTGIMPGTSGPLMMRLERKGLVTSWRESQDELQPGKYSRRFYSITPKGQDELKKYE